MALCVKSFFFLCSEQNMYLNYNNNRLLYAGGYFVFFLTKIPRGTIAKFYDQNGSNNFYFDSDKFGIKISKKHDEYEVLIDDYIVYIKEQDLS